MIEKRKAKILILNYKLLFEELISAREELSEGSTDLSYRLNQFRKKINSDIRVNNVLLTIRDGLMLIRKN